MKKHLLFIAFFLIALSNLKGQGLCNGASQIAGNTVVPASLTNNLFTGLGYNLGCNGVYSSYPNNQKATWMYCVVNKTGAINMNFNNSNGTDVDWCVWGPFAPGRTISDICANKLDNLAPVICDSGPGPGASGTINPTQVGQIYIILVVNFGGTATNYNLNFTGTGSISNVYSANLSALSLSAGTLSPAFSASTSTYTANVGSSTTSIKLTPTLVDPAATIKVNGTAATSGSATGDISLAPGDNTITIEITAADHVTVKTYTVTVTRAVPVVSSVSTLSNVVLSAGNLNPVFQPNTLSYTALVSNTTNNITITPTATNANATVMVNTAPVASGTASSLINLNVGLNNITTVVTAQDGVSTSTYTIAVTRDKATPAISFAGLPGKTYGDADFDAGATSSNTAMPVTYTSSNTSVATIVNGKIHIVGAGTTNITASQAADAGNYAATDAIQQLTVGKVSLTVTADAKTKVYGQADPALTYQISSGALVGTDAFTGSLTRNAGENAGTYAINQGTLALNSNYTLTYNSGNLTITPAALTITADNKSKVYGQTNPALTAAYSGFINGDNASSLTTQPTLTTTATTNSPVGNYAITASGAVATNYTLSYVAGSLSVTPATLTITADNKSKVYGQTNPALTVSYSGFINGDDASKLTSPAVAATTATTASGVGAYDITVSGAASNNYSLVFNKGTLTVTPAPLTVTANNKSKVYGTANPALTLSYSGFINGDGISSLATQPVAATAAATTSNVGTYAIVPANGVSANYSFNYLNGTLTITQATRTLTFNALNQKTYGDADFSGNATASTGEAVIYTSSNTNVAAIVNGKIHIVGAGMTNITATVAANSNYTSTPAITQTLVVNKASQTIAFAAISNQMKGSQYSLSSVTASSGLPVTLSSSDPVIASVSGFALTSNRLGRVSIMATQPGDNNYLPAAAVTQTFDVVDAAGNEVLIRKAVSPNGDGINDFLYIEGVNEHPNNAVTIINRNGVKVFEIKNYDNSSKVFDGHSNVTGAMQQAGTYFYLLEYTVDGVGRRQTGWFVLKY
jgi:gliding motility-associated-like protein